MCLVLHLAQSSLFDSEYWDSNIDSVGRNRQRVLCLLDVKFSTNESERIFLCYYLFEASHGFWAQQLLVKRNHQHRLRGRWKVHLYQTPVAHDFSPYMHVHSGKNLYTKKIVIRALFLHPFIHSFTHPVLFECLLYTRRWCRCWDYSIEQRKPCPQRICSMVGEIHTQQNLSYVGRTKAGKGEDGAPWDGWLEKASIWAECWRKRMSRASQVNIWWRT